MTPNTTPPEQNSSRQPAPDAERVRAQLQRIVSSSEFAGLQRMAAFLRCVTERVLNGESRAIKQYTIAVEVYGRDASFNPKTDTLVRVEAGRLRRALDKYYSGSGQRDTLLMELPVGTYVPRFVDDPARADTPAPADNTPDSTNNSLAIPVVAVFPMTNQGEAQHSYLVNGIGEELTAELSRCNQIRVIAFSSTAQLCANASGDAMIEGASELGADYALGGTLRMVGKRLRINIHLIQSDSGELLWAERFDAEFTPARLFEIEDRVVQRVIGQVADTYGIIARTQTHSAAAPRVSAPSAYEAILRALHYQLTMTCESFQQSLATLQHAAHEEPGAATVWALLSQCYLDAEVFGFEDIRNAVEQGIQCADRAVSLDPGCQFAQHARAYAGLMRRDRVAMRNAAERIIEINPNAAYMVGCAAFWLCLAGDYHRAVDLFERSTLLNPVFPSWLHAVPYFDSVQRGDYETALIHADEFGLPDFFWGPLMRTAALGLLGRSGDAGHAYQTLLDLKPDFAGRASAYVESLVLDEALATKMLDGLELAARGA